MVKEQEKPITKKYITYEQEEKPKTLEFKLASIHYELNRNTPYAVIKTKTNRKPKQKPKEKTQARTI